MWSRLFRLHSGISVCIPNVFKGVNNVKLITTVITILSVFSSVASAQDVWITPEIPFVEVEINDEFIVIERVQDNNAVVVPAFTKTSRPCPPFCVQEMSAAEGVITVGEIELLQFMQDAAVNGNAYVVDARKIEFFEAGTIPGAINLPFDLFSDSATNPFMVQILTLLKGVQKDGGDWDLSEAPDLALFCNGPWCDQSPRAISNLIAVGYPREKLFYYRGGMQSWMLLGLTVVVP